MNPKISVANFFINKNVAIGNSIRKIYNYINIGNVLNAQIAISGIKFNFINNLRIEKDAIVLNFQLDENMIRTYFNKYIYTGLFRGGVYLFNAFGRCLISNQLRTDINKMNFTQMDFEKLLYFVYKNNEKRDISIPPVLESGIELLPEKSEECIMLNYLVKILNIWLNNGLKNIIIKKEIIMNIEILNKHFIDAIQNNLIVEMNMYSSFMENISNMIDDYTKLWNMVIEFDVYISNFKNKTTKNTKRDLVNNLVSMTLEELNKNMYNICLDNLKIKVLPKEVFSDTQSMFQIINMIDSMTTNALEAMLEELNDVKSSEKQMENILLGIGEFPELVNDYITHLDEQTKIRPNINYQNSDMLIQNFKYNKKRDFIYKLIQDITLIVNTIKNNSWNTMRTSENISYHMKEFFIFKENADLFGKLSGISNSLRNIINICKISGKVHISDMKIVNTLFNGDFISKLSYMCLIWMLNDYLTIVDNKQVVSLEADNNDFDFKDMLDTRDNKKIDNIQKMQDEYKQMKTGVVGIDIPDDELGYYPEIIDNDIIDAVDNYQSLDSSSNISNEPGEVIISGDDNFQTKLKSVKTSQKTIIIDFIKKCINYMDYYNNLYNEMNEKRILSRVAKEKERQTRANLEAYIGTSAEGRELDRMVINNLMAMGGLKYQGLNEYVSDMFGDNFIGEEMDERQDGDSIRHGLDAYEQDEMGYVGEAEDMEEMDYGYMGVD